MASPSVRLLVDSTRPPDGESAAPIGDSSVTNPVLPPISAIQASPEPSIAIAWGLFNPPPENSIPTVKSFGTEVNAGENGATAVAKLLRLLTFTPGLCAMLMAAAAVSDGTVPLDPFDCALLNSV